MANWNDRMFGDSIPPETQWKLEAYQQLQKHTSGSQSPEDIFKSVQVNNQNVNLTYGDVISTHFPPAEHSSDDIPANFSQRTPVARMWTALEIQQQVDTGKSWKTEKELDDANARQINHIYVHDTETSSPTYGYVIEKKLEPLHQKVYTVGSKKLEDNGSFSKGGSGDEGTPLYAGGRDDIKFGAAGSEFKTDEFLPNERRSGGLDIKSQGNKFFRYGAEIKDVSVSTEGSFGLIKNTTINFVVHDFHDYDKIYNRYFLKPGATIFVDLAWSTTELYNPECIIGFEEKNGVCPDGWGEEAYTLTQKLYETKLKTGDSGFVAQAAGDLEVIMGQVSKWDSKVRKDESVECSITLVSRNTALLGGDFYDDLNNFRNNIIHSLDAVLLHQLVGSAKMKFKTNEETATDFVDLSATGYDTDMDKINNLTRGYYYYAKEKLKDNVEAFPFGWSVREGIFLNLTGDDSFDSSNLYVAWSLFENKILNTNLGFGKTFEDVMGGDASNNIKFDSSNTYVHFGGKLLERQIFLSNDKKSLKFLYPFYWGNFTVDDGLGYVTQAESYARGLGYGWLPNLSGNIIGNIPWSEGCGDWCYNYDIDQQERRIPLNELFVRVDVIKSAFLNNNDIKSALLEILDELNATSGDRFNLTLTTNPTSNIISVVNSEQQLVSSKNFYDGLFTFKLFGENSIVKDFDLQLKTPSKEFTSMLAIMSGMSSGNQVRSLGSLYDKYINGSYDGTFPDDINVLHYPDVGVYKHHYNAQKVKQKNLEKKDLWDDYFLTTTQNQMPALSEEQVSKMADELDPTRKSTTKKGIKYTNKNYIETKAPGDIHGSISSYYNSEINYSRLKNQYSQVMPLTLSLKTYGLASIIPGNCFKVDMLPEKYRGLVYFQITKVSHSLTSSGWETNFETVMRIRKDETVDLGLIAPDNYISVKYLEGLKCRGLPKELTTNMFRVKPEPIKLMNADGVFSFEVGVPVKIGQNGYNAIWGNMPFPPTNSTNIRTAWENPSTDGVPTDYWQDKYAQRKDTNQIPANMEKMLTGENTLRGGHYILTSRMIENPDNPPKYRIINTMDAGGNKLPSSDWYYVQREIKTRVALLPEYLLKKYVDNPKYSKYMDDFKSQNYKDSYETQMAILETIAAVEQITVESLYNVTITADNVMIFKSLNAGTVQQLYPNTTWNSMKNTKDILPWWAFKSPLAQKVGWRIGEGNSWLYDRRGPQAYSNEWNTINVSNTFSPQPQQQQTPTRPDPCQFCADWDPVWGCAPNPDDWYTSYGGFTNYDHDFGIDGTRYFHGAPTGNTMDFGAPNTLMHSRGYALSIKGLHPDGKFYCCDQAAEWEEEIHEMYNKCVEDCEYNPDYNHYGFMDEEFCHCPANGNPYYDGDDPDYINYKTWCDNQLECDRCCPGGSPSGFGGMSGVSWSRGAEDCAKLMEEIEAYDTAIANNQPPPAPTLPMQAGSFTLPLTGIVDWQGTPCSGNDWYGFHYSGGGYVQGNSSIGLGPFSSEYQFGGEANPTAWITDYEGSPVTRKGLMGCTNADRGSEATRQGFGYHPDNGNLGSPPGVYRVGEIMPGNAEDWQHKNPYWPSTGYSYWQDFTKQVLFTMYQLWMHEYPHAFVDALHPGSGHQVRVLLEEEVIGSPSILGIIPNPMGTESSPAIYGTRDNFEEFMNPFSGGRVEHWFPVPPPDHSSMTANDMQVVNQWMVEWLALNNGQMCNTEAEPPRYCADRGGQVVFVAYALHNKDFGFGFDSDRNLAMRATTAGVMPFPNVLKFSAEIDLKINKKYYFVQKGPYWYIYDHISQLSSFSDYMAFINEFYSSAFASENLWTEDEFHPAINLDKIVTNLDQWKMYQEFKSKSDLFEHGAQALDDNIFIFNISDY